MAATTRLGVAGQSATISYNDAGEAVQIVFVRPVSCKAGDSLHFDGCSSVDATTVFEVASVKGRRIVDVVPEHILDPSATTILDSGIAVVSAAPAAEKSSSADDAATSTDGSDTEGSLADFIEKDPSGSEEEEEEEESDLDEEREAQELVAEFPFDRALLEEQQPAAAEEAPLRRSRRARAAPTRYVDEKYETLMMEDVSDISSESEEECIAESDDAEFESVGDASESEEEESSDEEYI